MDPIMRRATRLIVINSDGEVLLFQYEDDQLKWWATPGGGLEGEETFEEAAAREAAEELPLACTALTFLWRQTIEFRFRGQSIRQDECYFLARLSRPDSAPGHMPVEAHRREGIVAARWWSLEEIETTSERIFPEDLCRHLRSLRS